MQDGDATDGNGPAQNSCIYGHDVTRLMVQVCGCLQQRIDSKAGSLGIQKVSGASGIA